MSEGADLRFAAPQTQVADVAPEGVALAGRGMRLLAALLDVLVLGAAAWVVLEIPALRFMAEARAAAESGGWAALDPAGLVLGFLLFLLVQGLLLVRRGQTVGKLLLRLRIERTDGSKADAWRLLGLRYGIGYLATLNIALATIYVLVDSLLIFRESRQCLHDSIADTRVVRL